MRVAMVGPPCVVAFVAVALATLAALVGAPTAVSKKDAPRYLANISSLVDEETQFAFNKKTLAAILGAAAALSGQVGKTNAFTPSSTTNSIPRIPNTLSVDAPGQHVGGRRLQAVNFDNGINDASYLPGEDTPVDEVRQILDKWKKNNTSEQSKLADEDVVKVINFMSNGGISDLRDLNVKGFPQAVELALAGPYANGKFPIGEHYVFLELGVKSPAFSHGDPDGSKFWKGTMDDKEIVVKFCGHDGKLLQIPWELTDMETAQEQINARRRAVEEAVTGFRIPNYIHNSGETKNIQQYVAKTTQTNLGAKVPGHPYYYVIEIDKPGVRLNTFTGQLGADDAKQIFLKMVEALKMLHTHSHLKMVHNGITIDSWYVKKTETEYDVQLLGFEHAYSWDVSKLDSTGTGRYSDLAGVVRILRELVQNTNDAGTNKLAQAAKRALEDVHEKTGDVATHFLDQFHIYIEDAGP